jgi:hypothetical protein
MADGSIENIYSLKIGNEDAHDHAFHIAVTSGPGTKIDVQPDEVAVSARSNLSKTVSVRARATDGTPLKSFSGITFTLQAIDDARLVRSRPASFLAGE